MFGGIKEWPAIGVEIAGDRSQTWVARAARHNDRVTVELLDPIPGTTALLGLLPGWVADWRTGTVAIDPRSPSATLVGPLEQVQLQPAHLVKADASALATAHGNFADLLAGGQLKVRGHRALDEAARLAAERRLSGAHAVDRFAGADPAPLVAAELAAWGLLNSAPPPFFAASWR
jgi:hypothetical protein